MAVSPSLPECLGQPAAAARHTGNDHLQEGIIQELSKHERRKRQSQMGGSNCQHVRQGAWTDVSKCNYKGICTDCWRYEQKAEQIRIGTRSLEVE